MDDSELNEIKKGVKEIRDELIKIRTILDFDITKTKQMLTNLIKKIEV